MDRQRKSLHLGAAVILLAIGLRLLPGVLDVAAKFLAQPEVASFLIYLETGRILRPFPEETVLMETVPPQNTKPPQHTVPEETAVEVMAQLPVFSTEDTALVKLKYHAQLQPDLEQLLCQELRWDLTENQPTVLILHSHATESYTKTKTENYKESSDYRTLNEDYNMLSIGDHLAERLKEGGLGVVHAKDLHDYPSYSGSYVNSRKTVQAYLKQYPTIQLVLDLHRDAADDGYGGQMDTSATVDGKESARLMMVVGTNASGRNHPNWEENLALALKLHVVLEKRYPGLCRTISFRKQRFNQDLSPGAMLIEVGAAGNTRAEALVAADALAWGILELAKGSATSYSTD